MDQSLERSAFAGFSSRLSAGLIDWLIVFAALWVAAIIQAVLGLDGPVSDVLNLATPLLPVLYFGLFWSRDGQTVGMRTTNIQMVDTQTWDPPSWIRASLRGFVAVLTFIACGVPLVAAFGDGPNPALVAAVALSFAALALIGHLWSLRDPRRQSLQDRLFGLAVVKAKPQEERTLATPVSTRASLARSTRRRDDDPERPPEHRPARDRRPA